MDSKSLIITCGCGDTSTYAKAGWRIKHPDRGIPPVIELDDSNRPLIEMLMQFFSMEARHSIDLGQPFAFSVSVMNNRIVYDEETGDSSDGADFEVINLLSGDML